ncbi:hypothetical protein [Thalassovita taeanensis]|uniref:Uncharacterized protein n=1 Tax=Thalassovita taeanensis TaxID=657014 RepID=A0A1H9CS51_9RHOB|nr:hypothetical protein [Thalassovita taeanensis]SEQ04056.1 hypothetical protein SAMN04488092_103370 [Thalassovita taeanensis]
MTTGELLLGLGGVCLAGFSFLLGRIFSQSEAVLAEKRRVYEEFLTVCPMPNDAYKAWTPEREQERTEAFQSVYGKLMLYAAPAVTLAISLYLDLLNAADIELGPESEPLHPAFKEAAKAHNDIILEMRRDALGLSMFGYYGKSRLPANAYEEAKRKSL